MNRKIFVAVIAVMLFCVVNVSVASDDAKWIVRGSYVNTWPNADKAQVRTALANLPDIFTELSVDNGQGFGLDIEYKFNPNLGLVLTGIFTDLEGTFVYGIEPGEDSRLFNDNNTVDFYTINLGANYHFTPDRAVDFYAGAFAGVFSYDSVTFRLQELGVEYKIDFDDQFSFGVGIGVDIPLKADSGFIFNVSAKYLVSDLKESGNPREIKVNPILGTIGIGWRF